MAAMATMLAAPAWAQYQKAQGWCELGGVKVAIPGTQGSSTSFQQSAPSCTVTVYDTGTVNLSTLYSNSTGTAKANPFTAASTGAWFFYAAPSTQYDVVLSGGGLAAPVTISDVSVNITTLPAIDVRDYGAKCDGVTDDATALAAAITAGAGGRIVLPNGTCKFSTGLTLPAANTEFAGQGGGWTTGGATKLVYTGSGNAITVSAANTRFHGFALDNQGTAAHGFYLSGHTEKTVFDDISSVPTVKWSADLIGCDTNLHTDLIFDRIFAEPTGLATNAPPKWIALEAVDGAYFGNVILAYAATTNLSIGLTNSSYNVHFTGGFDSELDTFYSGATAVGVDIGSVRAYSFTESWHESQLAGQLNLRIGAGSLGGLLEASYLTGNQVATNAIQLNGGAATFSLGAGVVGNGYAGAFINNVSATGIALNSDLATLGTCCSATIDSYTGVVKVSNSAGYQTSGVGSFGRINATLLARVYGASNNTTGTDILPTLQTASSQYNAAVVGDGYADQGAGFNSAIGVVGVAKLVNDTVGHYAYGGYFKASTQNNSAVEVGLHAETVDTGTSPTIAEFASSGTVKAKFDGDGTLTVPKITGVTDTGVVANLHAANSDALGGATFASPSAIGSGTPAAVTGTTVTANTSVTSPLYKTTTNCTATGSAANPSLVACTAAPAGAFSCAAAASTGTCVVSTTAVTANSEVIVQQVSYLNSRLSVTCNTADVRPTGGSFVTAISASTSFTVSLGTVTTNPACFVYWIVN